MHILKAGGQDVFGKNSPTAANIQGALHVDRYLTDFSMMFVQDESGMVSMKAASLIPVQNQTDIYVTYDRGYFWRDEALPRPLGGRPQQVGYKLGSASYTAIEYGLEATIDDRQRVNADDPIDLDENAVILLTQKMMIKQERMWCQRFFTAGIWTSEQAGVASSPGANQFLQFNDAASNPIDTIDTAKEILMRATGYKPNTLVLGSKVKKTLRSHPDISDRIKYTQMGVADDAILASLFEVENLMVARGVYNSANEGATDSFQFIADETAMWLGYIDPNPSVNSPTAIANFAWTGLIPGQTSKMGGVIERGRDDRAHSDYIQDRMAFDLRLVSQDLGCFFNDAVV